ncbi:MAG TPA: efflux transporter outer membrane subunit [Nevskia sp.]|nr:efflux transporter outer membrane subunit [Nevskia sp.]
MNSRQVAALFLSLALAACADFSGITPQSQPLDPRTLDPGAALQASADAAWPTDSWWRAYGDAQLDRLVAQAVAGNPSLRSARARVEQAAGLAAVARAGTLPRVDAASELTRTYGTHAAFPIDTREAYTYWENTALLKISYDLDLWGKDRAASQSALDSLHAAEVEARAAQLALASAVTQGYVQLAAQYLLRDVAEANLQRQRKVLDIARRRYQAGLGTQLEITQASTVLPDSQAQIERIDESIALLRNQLAALMGRGPGEGERIARPALRLEHGLELPARLPAGLLGHRPDIVAQRWRVEAAAQQIKAAKAGFYPDVNLVAAGGVASFGFSRMFTGDKATGEFGPAISLPIFEGGRLRGNLRAQSAAYDVAVEAYNSAVIGAFHEVADQVTSLRSLARQLELTEAALASARTAEDQAEQGFRAGLTDYLSVLNTQAELLVQQRNRAQIVARQLEAHAALMKALGGGYTEPAGRQAS